jgi:transcriptional regulator with XRE-family HTH domain
MDCVASQIRALRQQRGFTQRELAGRAGMVQEAISTLETAAHSPTVRTLKRIADALDVTLEVRFVPSTRGTRMDRLDEIEARANAAAPGPWVVGPSHVDCGEVWIHTRAPLPPPDDPMADPSVICTGLDDSPADAAFIAHAREDIPWLVSRIRELETVGAGREEDGDGRRTGDGC